MGSINKKLFFLIILILISFTFINSKNKDFIDYLFKYKIKKFQLKDDKSNDVEKTFKEIIESIENLMSNLIALSIHNATDISIFPNDPEIIEEAKKCQESYSIFYYDPEDIPDEINKERIYYLLLLYYDSSKSKNDLGSYTDCTNSQTISYKEYNITDDEKIKYQNNSTYIVVQINEKKNNISFADIAYQENEYLVGLCIKKGCSENVIRKTFKELNKEVTFFEEFDYDEIQVYDLDNKNIDKIIISIFGLIPFIIIIILIIFSCFKCLPNIMFSRVNPRKAIYLNKCFDLKNNHEEILGNFQKNENIVSNDTGLTIIKGLRGLNMIAVLISTSFFYIYHLPTKIYNKDTFKVFITSFSFSVVYYGARFGVKILYAISGFELVYKMLNYLDNCIENKEKVANLKEEIDPDDILYNIAKDLEENDNDNDNDKDDNGKKKNLIPIKEKSINNEEKAETDENEDLKKKEEKDEKNDLIEPNEKNKKKEKKNFGDFENIDLANEEEILKLESLNKILYSKHRANLEGKILLNFIFKQWHRYVMFIFAVIIFKWGVIQPLLLFIDANPMALIYVRQIANKFRSIHIFSNIFCFSPFSYYTFNEIDPFGMAYNEIIFFIIGSILIFYSYKYNLRLDLITIFASLFFFFVKIGIYFLLLFVKNHDRNYPINEMNLRHGFYPLMFFQYNEDNLRIKSFLLSNQFLNIPSFLIGILFGEMNYSIQNFSKANDKNKKYLNLPKKILNYYSRIKRTSIFWILVYFLLFGLIVFAYMFCIKEAGVEKPEDFFLHKWYNLIGLVDTDFGVLFYLLCIILLSITGDNILVNFLKHKYWGILSRTYWDFLITLHISACFIFYLSENRIKLIFYNVIFFSFELFMVVIIVITLTFVFVEIPFKKLNKIFIKNRDEILLNYKNK